MFLTYLTKEKEGRKKKKRRHTKKRKYSSAKDKRWVVERQQLTMTQQIQKTVCKI